MGKFKVTMFMIIRTFLVVCTGDGVNQSNACPLGCSCFTESGSLFVRCKFDPSDSTNDSSFPFVLPIDTSIVELQFRKQVSFSRMQFNHSTWHSVKELTMDSTEYVLDSYLSNEFLNGLDKLKVLRMHIDIRYLEPDVFQGTKDIEILDLSENRRLKIEFVTRALRHTLKKLKYLDISRIQQYLDEPMLLGTKFTESVRTKPLEVLNVSATKLAIFDKAFNYSSIKVLNVTRVSLQWMPRHISYDWFPNVRELDISYSSLPLSEYAPLNFSFMRTITCGKRGMALRYVYAHDMVLSRSHVRITYCYIDFPCGFPLLEFVDISNSNIRWLNCSMNISFLYLKTLIISRNSLEYISPKLFHSFPNMSVLRLEHNNLSVMQRFPDFEEIFSNNEALETLDVSWNGLSFLPRKLFVSLRNLKELSLQGNRIAHFDVDVRCLFNLRALDLSENGITLISSDVMHDLDTINSRMLDISMSSNAPTTNDSYGLNTMYTNTSTLYQNHVDLVINLQGNKFKCSCEHISFLTWVSESRIHFEGRSTHKCAQGYYIQEPDKESIHSLVNYCNLQRSLPFIIVPSVAGCLLIVSIVLICLYKRKRLKLVEQRRHYLNKYTNGETDMVPLREKRYPAFLSFCSIDDDIVKMYFLPTFEAALKKHFGDNEVLVIGETIFSPGKLIFLEIEKYILQSEVIVFLITLDFIESEWCRVELNQADLQRKPTIYLVENTVLKRKLPSWMRKLKTHTRATWTREGNEIRITPDWDVIAGQVLDFASAFNREDGRAN
ncbi:hypothetical protein CHS0354_025749 [Potamilus streckersoni]|uniref:TIR domain-containing protein n=1 Tax=Potamilus streckersoni TaxID=2493646 RepID=A0AAE0VJG7_9BIVA|nr:hypothetical protein CHS0354_025749 [Potamilus streckersoni]